MGRVELDITEDRKFQDIALLVDREDVLRIMISLRRKVKLLEKKIPKPITFENYILHSPNLRLKVHQLLKKYKYPIGFASAIENAITYNKITDKEMKNCYFKFHGERAVDKEIPPLSTPENAVLVTFYPYLLKNRKKIILNDVKELLNLMTIDLIKLPKSHILNRDTRPKIRLEREWYWKRKNQFSTTKIVDEYNIINSKEMIFDNNKVDQAISAYKSLLETSVF